MNVKYKIGLRTIKTTIVVFLCLLISMIFKRENAFYSTIAAAVCMQPTYEQTFKIGLNRVLGTAIGGAFGYGLLELSKVIPHYKEYFAIFIIPIVLLFAIYFCNIVEKNGAVAICCIVFLSIVANSNRDITHALTYVVDRVIDTTIGIVMAMLVNRFVAPRKSKEAIENERKI